MSSAEKLSSCSPIEGNKALTMDTAHALTALSCIYAACSITDNARKMDAALMLGGRRFGFG